MLVTKKRRMIDAVDSVQLFFTKIRESLVASKKKKIRTLKCNLTHFAERGNKDPSLESQMTSTCPHCLLVLCEPGRSYPLIFLKTSLNFKMHTLKLFLEGPEELKLYRLSSLALTELQEPIPS